MKNSIRVWAMLLSTVAVGAFAQSASAQDAAQPTDGTRFDGDDIVVTARKRAESLQDVPLSISVLSGEELMRRGAAGMEDYLRAIPGVSEVDNGAQSNAIVIRGITTSPEFENISAGATVGTYFGETPITEAGGIGAGGIDIRPVDLERVEVLRGPQGTAYGSASLSGTLRIIPAAPNLTNFGGRVNGEVSFTEKEGGVNSVLQGVINVPIVRDQLAIRAVAYRFNQSGYYRDVAGSDPTTLAIANSFGLRDYVAGFVRGDRGRMITEGGRVSALWKPTSNLDVTLTFLTQKIEQDGTPLAMIGDYLQVRGPVAPQGRLRGDGEVNDTDIKLGNIVVNYNMDWATLTVSGSRVRSGSDRAAATVSPFFGPASTTYRSDFDSWTGEARLASSLDGPFQFLVGTYYEDVDNFYQESIDWPGPAGTSPVGTNPMSFYQEFRKQQQIAVFGELSYEILKNLTVTVGGRHFSYDKDNRVLQEGGFYGVPIGGGSFQNFSVRENRNSYSARVAYKPSGQALLYASFAQGFRLGRPTTGLPNNFCDVDGDGVVDGLGISIESTRRVDSDFLDAYEAGGRFAFMNGRLTVNASAYRNKWNNLPLRVTAPCFYPYLANVGAATTTGGELQIGVRPTSRLKLDFGLGYTRARLDNDQPALSPPAFKGDRLPGSPEWNLNFSGQYDFPLGGYPAFIRTNVLYVGEFFGDLQESPGLRAGDYVTVDVRTGVALGNFNVELFARNLFNEDAYTWRGTFDLGPAYGYSAYGYQLRPRTIGMQIGYRF